MQAFEPRLPPLHADTHGVVRVGATRVSLESIVVAFDGGASAEEIVESFPVLDLATTYATLAYVLANRADVDEYLAARRADVERLRAEAEQRFETSALKARFASRRGNTST